MPVVWKNAYYGNGYCDADGGKKKPSAWLKCMDKNVDPKYRGWLGNKTARKKCASKKLGGRMASEWEQCMDANVHPKYRGWFGNKAAQKICAPLRVGHHMRGSSRVGGAMSGGVVNHKPGFMYLYEVKHIAKRMGIRVTGKTKNELLEEIKMV